MLLPQVREQCVKMTAQLEEDEVCCMFWPSGRHFGRAREGLYLGLYRWAGDELLGYGHKSNKLARRRIPL